MNPRQLLESRAIGKVPPCQNQLGGKLVTQDLGPGAKVNSAVTRLPGPSNRLRVADHESIWPCKVAGTSLDV
jgi:hypothetical protein